MGVAGQQREKAPTAQSKRSITKVMFLCAVGRPHERPDGSFFDGLVGIWPFLEERATLRNSKNRAAGSTELKPVNVDART